MTQKPSNDGRDLERAVALIERIILNASGVPPQKLTIEPRKRCVTDEVQDEVDLYVRIENAPGYESIALFECRDRKKRTDKNDIDNLQAKMKRLGAGQGFFIARGFTKSAKAVARQSPVVRLHVFQPLSGSVVADFEVVASCPETFGCSYRLVQAPLLRAEQQPAVFRGEAQLVEQVAEKFALLAGQMRSSLEFGQPEDVFEFGQTFLLQKDELTVAGYECLSFTVQGSVRIKTLVPFKVVSIQVDGRGKVCQRFFKTPDGKDLVFYDSQITAPLAAGPSSVTQADPVR